MDREIGTCQVVLAVHTLLRHEKSTCAHNAIYEWVPTMSFMTTFALQGSVLSELDP